MRTHSEDDCYGNCPIHAPSDHPMVDWPLVWRPDRHLFERICPHGVGHPDPDSVAWLEGRGVGMAGVHGCDGCCFGSERNREEGTEDER